MCPLLFNGCRGGRRADIFYGPGAVSYTHLDDTVLADMLEDLKSLPAQVEMLLNNKEKIQRFANRYLAARDCLLYTSNGRFS